MTISERTSKRLWAAYIGLLLSWSFNSYCLLYSWMQEGTLFARKINGRPCILDFILHYEAGELGLKAKPQKLNIYDPKIQSDEVEHLVAPVVPEMPFYLQYPPLFFVLCIPFALLPLSWSWLMWSLAGVGCLIASTLIISNGYFKSRVGVILAIVLAISAFPTWLTVELGQTSLFFLASMSAYWILLKQRRYVFAGIITFFLMVKVQYLPFVLASGLIIGRLRYALGCLIAACVAVLLCALVLGWDNCLEWPRTLFFAETTANYAGVAPENQQNLRGILFLLLGSDTRAGRLVAIAACVLASLASAFLWTKPYANLSKYSKFAFPICASLSTLIMLIFSVHTHVQDYVLFLIPCLWLWLAAEELDELKQNNPGRQQMRALTVAFPAISWLLYWLRFLPCRTVQPFVSYAIVMLALAIYLWFRKKKPEGNYLQAPPG